ncbi:MAG: hypothetical protein RLZZ40_403 [Actinomycetota bacterium]
MRTESDSPVWWAYALIGVLAGVFSGFFGVGGGIVMVPLLTAVLGLDHKTASVTSLAAIIPIATTGAISFLSNGTLPLDQVAFGLVIALGAAVTAPLGTRALRTWPVATIRWIFIGVLFAAAIMVFVTLPDRSAALHWSPVTVLALVVLGGVMGFVAGLLGVGGGLIVVPALIVLFDVSDLAAKALSLIAMVPAAVSGTASSGRAGRVDWVNAAALGIPASVTSSAGVWLATIVPVAVAQPLLAVFILYAVVNQVQRALRNRT